MARHHGQRVTEIVQRVVNGRVAGGEQNIQDRPGSEEKQAGFDEKRKLLRQRKTQPTGYGSFHEKPLPSEVMGIFIPTAPPCQAEIELPAAMPLSRK